jgi:glutamate synthase domain-containing protein 1
VHGSSERDSCGIGFVADVRGRASRGILDAALDGLRRMQHRGAVAADRRTGDGAGVLVPNLRRKSVLDGVRGLSGEWPTG